MIKRKSSVILINPKGLDGRVGPPLGLGYVASSVCRDRDSVKIYDLNYGHSVSALHSDLVTQDVALVGISAFTNTFHDVLNLASAAKELSPGALVVLGGHHASLLPDQILKYCQQIDVVVVGEAEVSFRALVKCLDEGRDDDWGSVAGIVFRDRSGNIRSTGAPEVPDLDRIAPPARHLLPSPKEYSKAQQWRRIHAPIITSRGCPHRCSFCSISAFPRHPPKWRARKPEDVREELKELCERYGVQHFQLLDSEFLASRTHALGIVESLSSLPAPTTFGFSTRPDSVVRCRDILAELAKAGCTVVELGIESGSPRQLTRFEKGVTVDTAKEALALLREHRIDTYPDFIMFEPFSTHEDIGLSLSLIESCGLQEERNENAVFSSLSLYHGTKAMQAALKEGLARPSLGRVHWSFAEAGVANLWSYLTAFKLMVLPVVKRMRHEARTVASSGSLSKKEDAERICRCSFVLQKLSLVCFDYVRDALDLGDERRALRTNLEKYSRWVEQLESYLRL